MSSKQVIFNLEKLDDNIVDQGLDILEIEGKRSVRKNFEEEGRPFKWKKKKRDDGRRILRGKTNRLFNTINSQKDRSSKSVKISSNLPYSKIHQEGGTITRKPGTVKLRKTKSGAYRFAKKTNTRAKEVESKGGVIVIPKREFMNVPLQDSTRILNKLKKIKLL
ncbi:MAG TPA: phage virion morphogenesis protein [Ignavibacteria bacterium]|nr:hypothetical protein [Bacteroidota bacterium]HRE10768.1 phage virion morphogenesis protein [Ignavibacteria bacterium]HRF65990.1 phage virion morphogenesis protein [Ignavibacteria bacterium]HRJ02831.1 phage virion morphogenesis protein [Ignavibacteria bacterium]HRJ84389.1 phage virion morphogenesis protein [Ignavibacteria bacterium]